MRRVSGEGVLVYKENTVPEARALRAHMKPENTTRGHVVLGQAAVRPLNSMVWTPQVRAFGLYA